MENFKADLTQLIDQLIRTQLYKSWPEYLISVGVDENEARTWGVEIGEMVYEYERSLGFLIDMMQTNNPEKSVQKLHDWIGYTESMTIWKLDDIVKELKRRYTQYLPPETDEDNIE